MAKMNIGVEASSWINIVAGLAIASIAWYTSTDYNASFYSGVLAGTLLVLAGVWTAWDGARNEAKNSRWIGALCILVGAWIFAYPWFVVIPDTYDLWSLLIGGAVMLVSIYETYAAFTSGSKVRERRPTA